jgi:hypothetical protein
LNICAVPQVVRALLAAQRLKEKAMPIDVAYSPQAQVNPPVEQPSPQVTPEQPPPATPPPTTDSSAEAQLEAKNLGAIDKELGQTINGLPRDGKGTALQEKYKLFMQDGKLDHFERVSLVHGLREASSTAYKAFIDKALPYCQALGINLGQADVAAQIKPLPPENKNAAEAIRLRLHQTYITEKKKQESQASIPNVEQTATPNTPTTVQQNQQQAVATVLTWAKAHPKEVDAAVGKHGSNVSADVQAAVKEFFANGGQLSPEAKTKLNTPDLQRAFIELRQAVFNELSTPALQQQQTQPDPVIAWAAQHPEALTAAINKHAGTAGAEMQQALRQFFTTGQMTKLEGSALTTFKTLGLAIYNELKDQFLKQQNQQQVQPQRTNSTVTMNSNEVLDRQRGAVVLA